MCTDIPGSIYTHTPVYICSFICVCTTHILQDVVGHAQGLFAPKRSLHGQAQRRNHGNERGSADLKKSFLLQGRDRVSSVKPQRPYEIENQRTFLTSILPVRDISRACMERTAFLGRFGVRALARLSLMLKFEDEKSLAKTLQNWLTPATTPIVDARLPGGHASSAFFTGA